MGYNAGARRAPRPGSLAGSSAIGEEPLGEGSSFNPALGCRRGEHLSPRTMAVRILQKFCAYVNDESQKFCGPAIRDA